MSRERPLLVLLALLALAADWRAADPQYSWSFPGDHWPHRDHRVEWWYFTGHLSSETEPGAEFGFQFTIFRIGLAREGPELDSDWGASHLLMGHASITDKRTGRHGFSEILWRESPMLGELGVAPGPSVAWALGPPGTDARWRLDWNGEGFGFSMRDRRQAIGFELDTRPRKPLVFQGPNGFSRKSEDDRAASLYVSFTRLDASGRLAIDGREHRVRGQAWMDHEFSSSQLGPRQVGWDWFSLQLDDGRELMLYRLRRAGGETDYARGTLVERDGRTRWLEASAWEAVAESSWTSPATGTTYPARWRISLPREGLSLRLVPEVAAQENVGRLAGGLHYWEGAVRVEDEGGRRSGLGYVELTGYGANNRPPV